MRVEELNPHRLYEISTSEKGRVGRLKWDAATPTDLAAFELLGCDVQPYGYAAVGPCWFRMAWEEQGAALERQGLTLVTFVRVEGAWKIAATRPSWSEAGPPWRERDQD